MSQQKKGTPTTDELLDHLKLLIALTEYVGPDDVLGPNSSFMADTKALIERADQSNRAFLSAFWSGPSPK